MVRLEKSWDILMIDKCKEILTNWQEKGVPIFFVRDNGKPSVSLTLVFISGTFIAFGLINGAAQLVKGIDMQSALYWHGMSLAAYLQRKYSKSGSIGDTIKKDEKN
jgi:hypothetical protein